MVKNKNRLGFEAQLSRHPHHMPAAYSASLSTGMIIPQWFDIAQAGDTYKMHPKMFARLQNVQTAFLGEVDINIKFFFVPLQMLYTPFGQIFAQTNDVISSMFKDLGTIDTFPMVAGDTLLESIPQAGFYVGHKECAGKETARLLDAFDLNPYAALLRRDDLPEDYEPSFNPDATPIDLSQCHLPSFSPWLLAAYQAVYQKHFRNDEYEKFNIAAFNVDQYWNNTPITHNYELIKLRYAQRPADYFTKTRVSPILSAINKLAPAATSDAGIVGTPNGGSLSELLSKTFSWLGEYEYQGPSGTKFFNANNSEAQTKTPTGFEVGSPIVDGGGYPSNRNVANIRAAFALDKFLRVYGRAGKTYDEQILAHFGVKIPHDVKHDLTEIAHFHGKLQADPIYATATIGQDNASVLGQVGGQGQVTLEAGKEIKFTAPVHGVMLAVAYAVTKPRYYGTFSKLNLLGSRIDFPIPEFDKLGAQPVYSFEVNPQALVFGEAIAGGNPVVLRFGWQNRWQQWKESYNRCSFLYAPADAFGEEQGANYVTENVFMPWLLSRPAFYLPSSDPDTSLRAVDLWESPNALNTVMDVVYDGNWSNDYFYAPHLMLQTDPILTDFYNDVTKVSWMSPTGEPDL